MKSYRQLRENSWLLLFVLTAVAFMSAGCSSSSVDSGSSVNPLGAYQSTEGTSGIPTDGVVQNPGAIDSPIISTPTDGSGSIDGHQNAPLLNNMHPGWQQSTCLSCHNDTSRNPDHNYTDSSMCYLCHGTNGLPGFGDNIPPIISGVVANPTDKTVTITWKTDENCLSRMVLRTVGGDRLEFPVSTSYTTSHRYVVNGLQANTNYYYELISTDKNGNQTTTASFGTLSFTTLDPQQDIDSISPTDTEVDSFFSGVSISADGSFKATVKFTVADPSTVYIYFIYDDTNQLADQMKLNDITGGPITNFDGFVTGLQAGTKYKTYLEATDTSFSQHKSKTYTITTDDFE
ncbi:MAG: hypothetical protein PWR01_2330 [Clostridiales bacterium]|jgi:hypothetical protein|nr:hypothetical protein [Clostridiales bacterium]MDN5281257.1 hypothetical protein [Candidatus Ozemobacter sp.]